MSIASPKHHINISNNNIRNIIIETSTTPRNKTYPLLSPSLTNITVQSSLTTPTSIYTSKSPKSRYNKRQGSLYDYPDDVSIKSTITAYSARDDLLTIGIDIDERTIERMQAMGIEKVFEAANITAESVKSKRKIPDGVTPILRYRDYDPPNNKETINKPPEKNEEETFQVDMEKVSKVIKHLSSIDSDIHPPTRLALENLLQHLRIQYFRSPRRFVRRLLGLPSTKSDKYIKDFSRLIVNTRLVDLDHFVVMIHRLRPDAHPSHLQSLFELISEKKIYKVDISNSIELNVVDIWTFLTLLQSVREESRRSYDNSSSKLSHTLEFWDKYFKYNDNSESNKVVNKSVNRITNYESSTVADVLGVESIKTTKSPNKIKGTISSELKIKSSVADAFNAIDRNKLTHIRRQRSELLLQSKAINNDNYDNEKPNGLSNVLLRESQINNSVAEALYNNYDDKIKIQSNSRSLKDFINNIY